MLRTIGFIFFLFYTLAGIAQDDCLLTKHTSIVNGRQDLEQRNTYDENGLLISEKRFHLTHYGEAYSNEKVFTYTKKGQPLSVTELHNGSFRLRRDYIYDLAGNLISESESRDSTDFTKKFNAKAIQLNGESEKLFFEPDGSVSGKEIRKETSEGKPLLFEIVNAEGKVNHSSSYAYNPNGDISILIRDDRAGNMLEKTFYTYDPNALLMRDSTTLNGQPIAKTLYEYDGQNVTKRTRLGRNNKLEYIINYSYDASGNNIKEVFVYNGEDLTTIERTFDLFGNKTEENHFNKEGVAVRQLSWEYSCPN
ncbi:hypothetical protein [Jiulongibacter sp. NS-SX5]|uniref:hypothetical protein n=1 Tax=Jiulongibacter sp. NS-SX5 TaxID=3463854 RepID=UPI00405830A0